MGAELAAATALIFAAFFLPAGMVTGHMLGHILIMNLLAPVLVWRLAGPGLIARAPSLLTATTLQLAVFLLWHTPEAMRLAMASPLVHVVMMTGLLAVAVVFWASILSAMRETRLAAIAALMLTGKVVCLIAALLVFAPRLLYPGMPHEAGAMMADQQLAGLIMLTACPLTYVGASIVFVARWFANLSEERPGAASPCG
jgi:putative membrane protein